MCGSRYRTSFPCSSASHPTAMTPGALSCVLFRKAEGQCAIDYAFHQIIGGVDEQSLKAMKYLTEHEDNETKASRQTETSSGCLA